MINESYIADNKGLRHDEGKTQYHLIPSDGLAELARVYTFGAKKYAPYNWERGMDHSRVFNSMLRHIYAYWDGENRDQETGLHHMAHAAWNALTLLVYSLRGVGVDDRKASYLSARQNKEASELSTEELDAISKLQIKGVDPLFGFRPLPPKVTNPYAVKKRKDLAPENKEDFTKSNMRCYNCPNDALPHHSVCGDCLQGSSK